MDLYNDEVEQLHKTIFNYPIIDEIDDDLILLSIIEPGTILNNSIKEKLLKKYGSHHYDKLEFLGDSVLELIISDILYNKNLSPGQMTKIRSSIVRNVSLICLMNDKKICNTTIAVKKSCADVFEAIVGAVYIHLNDYNVNPIKIMINWLNNVWHMDFIINDIINHPKEENICMSIQRSYKEYISLNPPVLDHIKTNYEKLLILYKYYDLGKLEMVESLKNTIWTIKIVCPLTLGCQYYNLKEGKTAYLSKYSSRKKNVAIDMASKEAIDIILNDYDLI